ncbi:NADH-ubiquinone oxidoreductase assembly factor N7BML [Colletotrichum gloeosporioides]|uniref:NADH-ubiquinone oxidoreductase assembly factor N7BML n=1 Tax=Colletotrichum gloeosporioides TaxID=474922 RepID=A0A8H4FL08_COLGL|nr:NADH-ubiquinone oxidoreductase assembly factor N7BML [Colletotrichum gloeosporioides]KAF3806178.1 NADH-ubiquinone oxidoreductase assembly factor N7BML [Colletotrichum gloeosporioides]
MSSTRISPILEAWYKWKSLRLPWRKRFLIGRDLQGYTYWEFREQRGDGPGRFRRIVHYPRSTYLSDVKVSPLWHQWLRHTREHPPSLEEQSREIVRQERMKLLAAQADARWEAKPRVMDAPGQATGQPLPALNTAQHQPIAPELESANATTTETTESIPTQSTPKTSAAKKKYGHDPWEQAKGPGEAWQPQAWVPPAGKK